MSAICAKFMTISANGCGAPGLYTADNQYP